MTHQPLSHSRGGLVSVLAVSLLLVASGIATAQGNSPTQLRRFVDQQVGGIQKMIVPAHDTEIPQPRLANGSPDPEFQTTEAKRYLGKLLFHEPARATRIIPEFGGIPEHSGTASCGTCHLGEAASKSGTLLNFATGGAGRGYTDAAGNFIARRRPLADLPILRQTPLFPGDALVDELPTLTDIYEFAVGSPARGRKLPPPGRLLRTGRLDALDSVARNSPSVIGAAFNNRLMVVRGLSNQIQLENASGVTSTGDPYLRVFLPDGVLLPGQSILTTLLFKRQAHAPPVSYTLILLSGQGSP